MDDILKTTWEDFYPNSKRMEACAKAKKLFKVYRAASKRFSSHLSKNALDELDELQQKHVAYCSQCMEDAFQYGFELGMRLMLKAQSSEGPKTPSPGR